MQPAKVGEHSKAVTSVKFSPSGNLVASASADGSILVFNIDGKSSTSISETSVTPGINQLKWLNSETHVVAASEDKQIKVYDIERGQCVLSLNGHRSSVFSVSVHPDINLVVSGSYDECIRLWDVRARKSIGEIEAHSDPISAVDFNANGSSFASSSYDGLIRVWESAYMKCLKEAYAPGAPPVYIYSYSIFHMFQTIL
jgi:COMPASS component SWD3